MIKPQLLNKLDVDEVELVLPVPSSTKTVTLIAWSKELPKGLSIRLSKELSKNCIKTV